MASRQNIRKSPVSQWVRETSPMRRGKTARTRSKILIAKKRAESVMR